jgi:hypothetical protein
MGFFAVSQASMIVSQELFINGLLSLRHCSRHLECSSELTRKAALPHPQSCLLKDLASAASTHTGFQRALRERQGKTRSWCFHSGQNTCVAKACVTTSHTGWPWSSVLLGQQFPSANVYLLFCLSAVLASFPAHQASEGRALKLAC